MADSRRQHVRGFLVNHQGGVLLEAPLYSGRAPSEMGSAQPALAEGSTTCRAGLNQGADMFISEQVPSEEWMLHPQVVQKI